MENFDQDTCFETVVPSNLKLIEAIKDEIRYLRNKNLTKHLYKNSNREKSCRKNTNTVNTLTGHTGTEKSNVENVHNYLSLIRILI